MCNHVSVQIAERELGIPCACLCVSKRYEMFYKKAEKGKKNAMFDLQGYLKYNEFMNTVVEMSKLFVEYLSKVENWTYDRIAKVGRSHLQNISNLKYGYKVALKLLVRFGEFYPFHVKRFDKYYGYIK